jgi:thiol-disulfide isomerase/thioredoxin
MTRRKVTKEQQRARGGARRKSSSRNWLVFAAVGGVAAVALIAALALSGGEEDAPPATGTVEVTGEALPPLTGGDDQAVGMAAPALQGQDFAGAPIAIANDGRPKALIFLAHWCPHCQAEVPLVQEWLDAEGMPTDADLYSVATSIDPSQPNYPPDAWLEEEGWTVPVLVDDEADSAATAYGLSAFPFWAFVDAEGDVVARASGELSIDQLEAFLAAIA